MWKINLVPSLIALTLILGSASILPPAAPGAGTQDGGRQEDISLSVDGRKHPAQLHLPAGYSPKRIYPLVVFLHGAGGDPKQAMEQTGLTAVADREGFLVCFAGGTGAEPDKLTWNGWNCCGYAMSQKVDDVKYLTMLLKTLKDKYPVDRARVFLAGFSNGAMMAYRYVVEGTEPVTGVAAVAGNLACPRNCNAPHPVSVLMIHGQDDQVVPMAGKMIPEKNDAEPPDAMSRAVRFWIKRNGGPSKPVTTKQARVTTETYDCAETGTKVVIQLIDGAGHAWPGGIKKQYKYCNLPTDDLAASEALWQFFKGLP